ncbi:BgtTE-56087 [Blumeria graminis f. sp. tritici]|uniref:BgtTE-56087 n=1 Tax=Blumeria graminis f. sp. tritici TaxID=62690 RepID=A0A9X9QEH1_BLUGR|nr:BgtTE-56087 [Blumeria graminis f. sp. tritici]
MRLGCVHLLLITALLAANYGSVDSGSYRRFRRLRSYDRCVAP